MSRNPCLWITALVLVLVDWEPAAWVSADEPLPMDGIDDPVAAPPGLPMVLRGPGGRDLRLQVALLADAEIHYAYGPAPGVVGDSDVAWSIDVEAYGKKGLAHKRLHDLLTLPCANPRAPRWNDLYERLPGVRGLFFRLSGEEGCTVVGVADQRFVRVRGTLAQKQGENASSAVRDRCVQDAESALVDLLSAMAQAPPALVKSGLSGVRAVYVEHTKLDGTGAGPASRAIRVQVDPAPGGQGDPVRFWITSDAGVKDVRTTIGGLRSSAAVEFPVAGTLDPTGTAVRVVRVIERERLRLEETSLEVPRAGERSCWTPDKSDK